MSNPLPAEGKPTDFTGLSQFPDQRRGNKTEVEVNQPVTVTIRISGVGNVKSVAEPFIPDLQDFRAYNASSNENISRVDNKLGGAKNLRTDIHTQTTGDTPDSRVVVQFLQSGQGEVRNCHDQAH